MKRIAILLLLLFPLLLSAEEANITQQRTQKWEFRTNDFIDSSPAIGEGTVFVGSADKNLYAFDLANGRERWRFATGGFVESSPAYSRGVVYVGSNDNKLYAINATSGEPVWQFNTSGKVYSSPAVAGSSVFVGSADGLLHALNASNGQRLWAFNASGQVFSSPAAFLDMVFVGTTGGKMYAVNSTTGEKLWEFDTGSPIYSSPKVVNNIVYFGAYNRKVYALNAFNGSKVWEYATNDKVLSSAAVGKGIVWIGSTDGRLYALNAFNGQLLWTFDAGGPVESSPFYSARANAVYFGSDDNNIYAVNASTGALLWKHRTANWVTSSPMVYNGVLYVGSYDKKFYAISTISTFILYPESGQELNGTTVTIIGASVADSGVQTTEIRIGADPTWRMVIGVENWTYTWGIATLQPGSYLIRVRTTDNNGDAEPEPYRQVSVSVRQVPHAFDKLMLVTYPERLRPGDAVRIEVRDEEGNPVPYPKVMMDGTTYYGDANGVVSRDQNGRPIVVTEQTGELLFTVEKTGYYVPEDRRLAIRIYREDYTPYIALAALVVIIIIGIYIWKKRRESSYV